MNQHLPEGLELGDAEFQALHEAIDRTRMTNPIAAIPARAARRLVADYLRLLAYLDGGDRALRIGRHDGIPQIANIPRRCQLTDDEFRAFREALDNTRMSSKTANVPAIAARHLIADYSRCLAELEGRGRALNIGKGSL